MAKTQIEELNEARHQVTLARQYLNKIGARQPHLGSAGFLYSVDVKTKICHQAYAGATNYWDGNEFDKALSAVIKSRFDELSDEAYRLMEENARKKLIECREFAEAMLEEIEKAEGDDADDHDKSQPA